MGTTLHIALAGNPNCGKTTLFNRVTGQNGYVGNWPGVTVEKKEAPLSRDKGVVVTDLPGIYSLSPYSPEEQVSRDYLLGGEPDVVVNVVDATNLERNLYLSLQVIEMGLPVVVALNMADLLAKSGDKVDVDRLSQRLGVPVVSISALKGEGVDRLFSVARTAAAEKAARTPNRFDASIEEALGKIEALLPSGIADAVRRYYAVKVFERDGLVAAKVKLTRENAALAEEIIASTERDCDDDAESIITSERYALIAHIMDECVKKAPARMSTSEKIDRVVTNRVLGLPIFIAVMFAVYWIAVSTFGTYATDWANDQLFGEGWFVAGQGREAYEVALAQADALGSPAPDPASFGPWVPGIPDVVGGWLEAVGVSGWVESLVLDGIVGGIGAILGFTPQMFILFIMLSFLEDCGYMSRVAFVMDRVFRRFGLSGKSFIPMLVAAGCGVPGVMATKTIENEKDRRMTVMTTTFIPCGAKLPIIALLMGALVADTEAWWISPLFYFLGVAAVIVSGLMLKKTRIFAGRPTPFVMELPSYHMPAVRSWALHVWERVWSFIKKAGTIIFASTIVVWFLSNFGTAAWEGGSGAFGFLPSMAGVPEEFTDYSVLAGLGSAIAWIFAPLGFDSWQATAMTVTGLVAKENVVATAGSLLHIADAAETDPSLWTAFAGMFSTMGGLLAFGAFNLLCAPCFAAMGTIRNQMASGKWTAIALGYECGFAWLVGLMINQFYLASQGVFSVWTVVAVLAAAAMLFQVFRPMPAWAFEDRVDGKPAAAVE